MGSIAAIVLLARRQRAGQALSAAVSLLGLVLLPPVLGFALFFGLCHSPRHFKAALRTLSIKRAAGWLPLAAPTTLAALAIGGALFVRSGAATEPGRLVSATFMLLSILTVPHMAAPLLLTALAALDPSSRHPSAPSPRAAA
jgi:Brp/Blh family beta-carotene 15,15'-monooxygenase